MVLFCFLWFLLVFLNGESNKRRLAECEPFLFSVFCQSVNLSRGCFYFTVTFLLLRR